MIKRILHITPFFSPNIGGVESHLDDLCAFLKKQGHYQYVITFNPLTTQVEAPVIEKSRGMKIYRYWWLGDNLFHKLEPYPFLEFLYLTPYLFFRSLIFMIRNHRKVDVIHAHGLNAAFTAKFLKVIFKKRAIMSTYAIYNFKPDSFFSKIVAWVFSSLDEIQPLAKSSEKELLKIGVPEEKMRVYYLWVNEQEFKPADKKETKCELGLKSKFLVLFVGRLIPIKGAEIIMEVAKRLSKVNFAFIGDGPLADKLKKEARGFSNIKFVGRVERELLKKYYQAADIFVLPSTYQEAFGKVAIEALFSGTPVIGANRGAIPDVISSQVGRVIEPTVDNFRREIEYLFQHPSTLAKITRNCFPFALRRYTVKNAKIIEMGYYE